MNNTYELPFPQAITGKFTWNVINPEEQEKIENRIRAKLEAGKRLSSKELNYLNKYNPVLYAMAIRVEMKRESIETRLNNAHSKSEADQILTDAMASVRKEDPAKQYLIAAIKNLEKEFKESTKYKSLPIVNKHGGTDLILLNFTEHNYQLTYHSMGKKEFTAVS